MLITNSFAEVASTICWLVKLILYCPAVPFSHFALHLGVGDGSAVLLFFFFLLSSSHCSVPLGLKWVPDTSTQNWVFPSEVNSNEYYLCSISTQILLQALGQSLRRKIILKDRSVFSSGYVRIIQWISEFMKSASQPMTWANFHPMICGYFTAEVVDNSSPSLYSNTISSHSLLSLHLHTPSDHQFH